MKAITSALLLILASSTANAACLTRDCPEENRSNYRLTDGPTTSGPLIDNRSDRYQQDSDSYNNGYSFGDNDNRRERSKSREQDSTNRGSLTCGSLSCND